MLKSNKICLNNSLGRGGDNEKSLNWSSHQSYSKVQGLSTCLMIITLVRIIMSIISYCFRPCGGTHSLYPSTLQCTPFPHAPDPFRCPPAGSTCWRIAWRSFRAGWTLSRRGGWRRTGSFGACDRASIIINCESKLIL